MPQLAAILETCLYVDDLDRAAGFYAQTLGLRLLQGDGRMRVFDVSGRGVLILFRRGGTLAPVVWPGGHIPPHDGSGPAHLAFQIAAADLPAWETRLTAQGVAIEGRARWPRGGESLYFRDPDGHLLELATPGLWPGY